MSKNRRKSRSGVAMVLLTTMVATVLIPIIGLAIDGTIMWMIKVKFVAAADSAALAGARSLSAGLDLNSQKAAAEATAMKYFSANFPPGFWNTSGVSVTATAAQSASRVRTVTVQGTVQSPLYFLQILGYKSQTIGAQSQSSRRDVNVELVLDRSSSMSGAMADMLLAAQTFVDNFSEGSDHVGLIVFGGNAVLAFPNPSPSGPASNFKTAVPSVDTLIGQTINGGNTGTAEAFHMAYTELVKKNDAGALNLIVMFTDGLPNGIVADYNNATRDSHGNLTNNYIRAGHCTHRGDAAYPMLGFMSQTNGFTQNSNGHDTNGIKTLGTSTVSDIEEGPLPSPNSDGCSYHNAETSIRADLSQLPSSDAWGNRLDIGYQVADLTNAVTTPYDFGKAAMNAADNQVKTIRANNALGIVIYTIGYSGGSEQPDETWMKRISNDPSSTYYDSSVPPGLYLKVPNKDQLKAAFNQVAAEILRLSM